MMQTNEKRRAAQNVIELMRRSLIEVTGWNLESPRPVIYIESPNLAWFRGKEITSITEKVNGVPRNVCIARVGACLVRWNNPIA